jgi:excisionase family DNA binding protein
MPNVAKSGKSVKRTGKKPAPVRAAHQASLPMPALLTYDEAASYLSMSRATLQRFVLRGQIKSIVIGRKFRRMPLKACDAWIEEQTGVA